tara:strand:+ start:1054 stop:2070 length:1017 start_codon:yes stop_codon:yes gene_type:complete
MPFLGTTPTQGFVGANPKQSFTANGSTTVFTLTNPVASANDLEVFVGNVRQEPTAAYTAAGTTLTMSEAPDTGLNFYVINKSQAQVTTTPPDGSVGTAKIVSNAVTTAKLADANITTAKIANDAITDVKLATDSVGTDAIGTGVVGTTQIAAAAVTDVKLDQTLGTMVKLANIDVANNTSAQLMFHSVLNGPYQVYKVIGKIGGSTNTGNATMQLRWVTGSGVDISGAYYHSGNYGSLSDGNFNIGAGINQTSAYILVHTSTGTTNFVEMTLIPSIAYGYGFIHTHDQLTHIGMTNFGFKYNSGFSNISGIKVFPSGGNMTLVDATVYGMKLSGSLGG